MCGEQAQDGGHRGQGGTEFFVAFLPTFTRLLVCSPRVPCLADTR